MKSFNLKRVAILIVMCSVILPNAALAQSPAVEIKFQIVTVEGHKMHVQTAGLDDRKPGMPVVVFEGGGGSTIGGWNPVITDVAAFAPAVAYERSGIGKSEWDGQTPTPERVVQKLHALLDEIRVEPPYVLVGHSWGGPLIRYFAGRYPEDVVGMVYIDPTDFTESRADRLAVLDEIGVDDPESVLGFQEQGHKFYISQASPGMARDLAVIDSLMKVAPKERGLLPAPEVPIAVLLGAKYQEPPPPPPGVVMPFSLRDLFEASQQQRVRKMSGWALESPEGLLVFATDAGHYVHHDLPALVIDTIHRVVFPDINRQLRKSIEKEGIEALAGTYQAIKQRYPRDRLNEQLLNSLGYELLQEEKVKAAIAVFELNVEEYPKAANPYDSLGDGYSAAGRLEDAKASYARAVELAEQQKHPNLETYRTNLQRVTNQLEQQYEKESGN